MRGVVIVLAVMILLFNMLLAQERLEQKIMDNEIISENVNNIIQTNTSVQVPKEELKENDEIEKLDNKLARCTANLSFRDYPNQNGKRITVIPKNTVINVTSRVRNGWYKISYDNQEGYVSNEYVTFLTDNEVKEITVKNEYDNTFAIVNISTELNIREKANKNSKRLTSVKPGSILKVFKEMENGWYLVEGNTIEGYVSGEYVKILTDNEYKQYSSDDNNLLKPDENVIATYTSTSTYNSNSRFNMHLAADYINGIIIEPGQSYSHLKAVHPEGEENKYVASTIFTGDGKTAQASGGGICQTSSTTYAAIASAAEKGINTGLNVSAQAPHSGSVNYVPRKYEATVSSGSQDFCFRNCNSYSIKIVTSYNYNTLTVTIYKL